MSGISLVVITLNEAANIGRCLESVKGVVDEMLVLDSGSTDGTIEICEKLGARVVHTPWEGYAATKNKGYQQATHNYILWLDADEVLSTALQQSILKVKGQLAGAYSCNRLNFYYGYPMRHGGLYPDAKPRLFHREQATWTGDFVHETLQLQPGTALAHLQGDLLHYTTHNIADHVARINKYSSLAAEGMLQRGKRFSVLKLMFSPIWRFKKMYLLKGGFMDGIPGLVVALLSGYAVALRYAKLWALQTKKPDV